MRWKLRELQLKYQLSQSNLPDKDSIQDMADIVSTKLWEKYIQDDPLVPFSTDVGEDRLLNLNLFHIMRLKDMKILRKKIPDVLNLPEFRFYPRICSVTLSRQELSHPAFKDFLNLKQRYYKIKYLKKDSSGTRRVHYKQLGFFEKMGHLEKEDDWNPPNVLVLDSYFGYFFSQNVLTGNVELVQDPIRSL